MQPATVRGRWFDGRSSQARPVRVVLEPASGGPALLLHPDDAASGAPLRLPHAAVEWPSTWSAGRAPRVLVAGLGAHGSLEIDDPAAWQAACAAAGWQPGLAHRMQVRWRVFAAVALLAAAGIGAFYRWGTPWAATRITAYLPLQWETALSERALRDLDARWLKPSQLPAARQQALRTRFTELAGRITPGLRRYPAYTPAPALQFRRGIGANAFALPGGTIVMTDEMVEQAAKAGLDDDALVGVLAHELGHVLHRHTTRMVVEQGVLTVGLGLALGDVSTVVSTGASVLTGLAYRRSHETEADCFAVGLMRTAGLPTAPMAALLLRIDAAAAKQGERQDGWLDLLSSHPATGERARMLQAGQVAGC